MLFDAEDVARYATIAKPAMVTIPCITRNQANS